MTRYPEIKLIPDDNDNFIIAEDCYVSEFNFLITKGAITDLTSIPRFLWWAIPPNGNAKKASIVHDFLVRNGEDKDYADSVYFYFLTKDVPKWQYICIILGIRLFPKMRNKYEKANSL